MTEPPLRWPQKCRECGADNDPHAGQCWLCHSTDLRRESDIILAELVDRKHDKPAWAPTENYAIVLVSAVTLLVIIVALGIYSISPGALIAYLVVSVPALLMVVVRASLKRARGEQISTADALMTFVFTGLTVLVSAAAVVGLLALLAIVAIIGFFVYCLTQLGQGGGAGS